MNIIVLGTSETTAKCADVLRRDHRVILLVSLPPDLCPNNSADLDSYARSAGLTYGEVADINAPESVRRLRELRPDVIFSMWPRLLSKDVIEAARVVTIGTHPAPLPLCRGRHPLHWSVALGIAQGTMSFFRVDEGVDHGPILLQLPFDMGADINEANLAVEKASVRGTEILAERLSKGDAMAGEAQDHTMATTWRKRTPFDSVIDCRMSGDAIVRMVRSYAPPYPCAKLVFRDKVVPIEDAEVIARLIDRAEPGKIHGFGPRSIVIAVDQGAVRLDAAPDFDLAAIFGTSRYIHPPMRYAAEHPGVMERLG